MTAFAVAPAMPAAADEEERLLVGARDGDEDAFNDLAGRYSTRLPRRERGLMSSSVAVRVKGRSLTLSRT
jgi:hypothetical protein